MLAELPFSLLTMPRPYPNMVLTGFGAGGSDGKSPPVAPLAPVPPIALDIGREGGGVGLGEALAELLPEATLDVGATQGLVWILGVASILLPLAGKSGNASLASLPRLGNNGFEIVCFCHVLPLALFAGLALELCFVLLFNLKTREVFAG